MRPLSVISRLSAVALLLGAACAPATSTSPSGTSLAAGSGTPLPAATALTSGPLSAATVAPADGVSSLATDSPADADRLPKFGGTYQYVLTNEPTTWDPHLSEVKAVQDEGIIYPRLLQFKTGPGVDPDSYIIAPDLAESWEHPDDLTYVFHLHQNGRWSREPPLNGRPIVASDVVYSFERLASDVSAFRSNWAEVDRVEAPDQYTVKFTLKYPFAPFLAYVAYHASRIVAPEVVQQCGDLRKVECAQKVGGGAWLLDSYQPGVQVVYRKNPDYYAAPKPYVDRIVAPIITDAAVREAAFTAGKIYSGVSISATTAQAMKAQLPELNWAQEGTAQYLLTFNVSRPPWNDVRVRQAVSMALNRQAFINTALFGFGRLETPSRVWFPDSSLSDDALTSLYAESVPNAKQLLAQAGYPNGFDAGTLLNAPGGGSPDQAVFIADQLKRTLNISLQIDNPEYAIGWDRFQKSDFSLSWGVYARSYPDPDDYLYARYHTGAGRNYSNCSDPKLDQLLDQQRLITDTAQRAAAIKDIDRYFITDVVCAIVMPSTTDYWPSWSFVKNFNPHISFGGGDLTNVWLDRGQ